MRHEGTVSPPGDQMEVLDQRRFTVTSVLSEAYFEMWDEAEAEGGAGAWRRRLLC